MRSTPEILNRNKGSSSISFRSWCNSLSMLCLAILNLKRGVPRKCPSKVMYPCDDTKLIRFRTHDFTKMTKTSILRNGKSITTRQWSLDKTTKEIDWILHWKKCNRVTNKLKDFIKTHCFKYKKRGTHMQRELHQLWNDVLLAPRVFYFRS